MIVRRILDFSPHRDLVERFSDEHISKPPKKIFLAVQQQRDRPVIDQMDFHHLLKAAAGYGQAGFLRLSDKQVVKRFGLFGGGGMRKGRPSSFPAIAPERELGNYQQRTMNVRQRKIEPALTIGKNPQVQDFLHQIAHILLDVVLTDP